MKKLDKKLFISEKDIDAEYNVFGNVTGAFHYHKYFEFELVIDGTGYQHLNDKYFEMKKGDIYVVKPLDYHIIHSNNLTIRNVKIDEKKIPVHLLKMLYTFRNPKQFELNEDQFNYFCPLFKRVFDLVNQPGKLNMGETTIICENLIVSFLNLDNDLKVDMDTISNKIIYFLLLNDNFTKKITLQDIADQVGYSKFYTSAMFHKETNTSIQDYIINLRIEYAKKLLMNNKMTIDEVSQLSGFTTSSNFYKKFFDIVKKTPSQYRKSVLSVNN